MSSIPAAQGEAPTAPAATADDDQISMPRLSDGASSQQSGSTGSKQYAAALLANGQEADASESRFVTSRTELWAFYIYYIGN
ncbi:uncharacterized protein PAN0_010c3991 [Moesziomyces antarcticus]|uniref:Uncharacterized protein n=1 Tax=Pseudozyma antarctica TaxID=84753 RepID=A0A081CGH5_PSEA2|nr:uncharacterized protein PAN0_010c3991 [Moesziomyces antarcticus]GAK65771.1 hypothetical protein PAN0_010c3991 [Moesziomyces antarcticus]